ncbi:MAG: helix-turn-helix domain-containing protein [Candidatus Rokuibacteriota bacterium]
MLRGLRLRELASKAGITPSALSQLERDQCNPTLGTLRAVAAALGMTIGSLFVASAAPDRVAEGEEIFVGTNLPIIRAGVLLAHLHHGPNMRVMVAHTRTNLYDTPVMEYFELLTDWRAARWAEGSFNDHEIVTYQKSRRDSVFFVGALRSIATATRT